MTQIIENHPHRTRTLYGRRQSRPLKDKQKTLYEFLLPDLRFSLDQVKTLPLDQQIWIEIGFGGGEHLCKQALNHPNVMFIGCEPFVNGVGLLLKQIEIYNVKNIRIFQNDARFLLEALPDKSVDKIFLLFPDPWPKKRHFKRRFVQQGSIKEIHRTLKTDGEWRIATDHEGYAMWVSEQFNQPESLALFVQKREDIYERPDVLKWPETRYEQKANLASRKSAFFSFEPKLV